MNQAIDFSTLTWVKNELDATLKEARQSLEAHVENPQDDAQLGFLTAHLHQVYGTLHMVELYGASLLAEEMEQVARGIAAGTVSQHDDACDVLMRAILQLPDYLDRLIAGYRDIPLVLLPLLNDLRAVRGENLLSENHMFSPDLDAAVPESIITPGTDGNGDIKAQALRHRFQLGLLGWFRGSGTQDALASMSGVLESLQNQSGDAGAARLWWVAAGIVDALRTETLESSIAVKRLMGQVDRQIKSVMDHGESFLTRNMPRDLFKNLLFYAGQAHGAGPRVAEIQSTYKLQDLLPGDEELAAARESMAGQNADLFATVAVAVKEELGRLKDTLDIVLRNGCREINELQPLADSLCSLGDTLGMLSLGAAREAVTSKSADLQRSIDAQEIPADTSLMDVASTLLFVESSVDGMGCGRAVADSGGKVEEQLARSEYNQVMDVVIQEAITDLLRAKEAIIAYIDSDNDTSALSEVPQWFNQVKGGLLLLGESRPAALVGSISRYIEKELVESNKQAPQQELDSLADAVCGLEYYLESRKEHRMYGSSAMSVAEESIDKLGYPALEDESAETVMEVEAAAAAPDTTETDLVESVGEAAENLAEETTLSAPPAEPASHQADDQGEELSVIGKEVDEEILEIFIEEAEEELASINELLPAWISDHDNTEAMSSMRRSWHTLKGSGRLVGALRIGEFAWAYENLLNRIIDGVVPVTPELTGLLQSAAEMLPQLVQEVRDGTPVQGSVSDLMSGAAALSSGKSPSATSASDTQRAPEVETLAPEPLTEPDFVPEAITPPVEAAAVADEEHSEVEEVVCNGVMDSMLYEIFNTEARGHLEVIREFLNQAALGDSMISEPLARALHTLHGSAHMAEAGIIADLAGALERWVKALMGAGQPLADDGRDVLTESVDIIDQMLSSLPGAISGPDRYEGLLQQINSLWEAVPVPAMDEIVMRSEAEPAAGMDNEPEDLYASCDDELLEVFIEESADNLETGGAALLRWCKSREDSEALAELQRALHTVKGGARIADITPMGDLAHAMESLVTVIAECKADTADSALDGVQDAQDSMVAMLESVRSRQSVESAYALINRLQELSERIPVADTAEAAVDETIEEPAMEEMVPAVAAEAVHAADDPYAETDQELLEVFLEEASDIMENSEQTLQNWKNTPDDKSFMTEFQRELHTLKGGARMADITEIGDLAHAVESLMVKVSEGAVAAGESMFMVLHQAHDCLSGMVDQVRNRQSLEQATAVLHDLELLTEGKDVVAQTANRKKAARKSTRSVALQGEKELEDRRTHSRTNHELVRVKATLLDNMVNFAGEVSIYRSRLEQQVGAYRFNLAELDQTVSRVREQLRKLDIETEAQVLFRYESEVAEGADDEEFDPLEMDRYSHMQQLSRSLAESVNDLGSLQGMLENITRESETLLLQQSRVNTELQEGLMRTRMVPFLSLAARMRRIVRQTANELGRKAELELSGAEGEMDRTVVDRIVAPLEHMLRNAISHGIESPEQRKKAGKKACGTINITLQRESSDVVLRISDDGAGIKMDAIRSKAVERGLMKADSDLTDNEVLQFILETGFSTAEKITQVAGRGVGMDVVNSEVKQLGGSLHIDSEPLKGTTFTIRLPFTLALNQALLIEVGEDTYAIPLSSIEGIVRMKREDLKAYYTDPEARFSYGGFEYEVRHLGSVLGTGSPHLDSGPSRAPVLLSRVGDHGVAFQVENLMGSREIVVKSVGPQISTVRGVSGATILGDGRVVMILDITAMLRSGVVDVMDQVEDMIRQPKAVETLTVMVVDDSITVRKVTTRLLERNDMNVITAKDGVDAVAKLQEHVPDIMLLDIEMPRMDGFELATHVRNEARLRDIPIIMITSRTGDKHRQRAMQIGVNRYLGKPFQESELLENIKGLLEEPGVDG
ncbi:MAG TPA: response regulator [Gammaproteobacteria bacterium]|nr:response regulator [Gammaproteobacteria bacterium]